MKHKRLLAVMVVVSYYAMMKPEQMLQALEEVNLQAFLARVDELIDHGGLVLVANGLGLELSELERRLDYVYPDWRS